MAWLGFEGEEASHSVVMAALWQEGQTGCRAASRMSHRGKYGMTLYGTWTVFVLHFIISKCICIKQSSQWNFTIFRLLWNLTGVSAEMLLRPLSNFKAIWWFELSVLWLQNFVRSYDIRFSNCRRCSSHSHLFHRSRKSMSVSMFFPRTVGANLGKDSSFVPSTYKTATLVSHTGHPGIHVQPSVTGCASLTTCSGNCRAIVISVA